MRSAMTVNYLTSVPANYNHSTETSLINGHQRGTTSPSLSLVTPTQTTSRRREDAYANIPSVVANSSISGCMESVKPDCILWAPDSGIKNWPLIMNFQIMRMNILVVILLIVTLALITWTIYALLNQIEGQHSGI